MRLRTLGLATCRPEDVISTVYRSLTKKKNQIKRDILWDFFFQITQKISSDEPWIHILTTLYYRYALTPIAVGTAVSV